MGDINGCFIPKDDLGEEDRALLARFPGPFLSWFRENARDLPWRRDRTPYHVWLSEIMLQQTRAEAVKGYYLRFLQALPDIRALAAAPEELVLKLWEGLGYYRRAQNLHKAAKLIVDELGGVFPSAYEGIRDLPGVGAYTAGAIASICFGLPKPAVDGNVLRVTARILDSDAVADGPAFRRQVSGAWEAVMRDAAAYAGFEAGDFNQSLMEIGATLCLPKGVLRCGQCPAGASCRGRLSGRAELLPVRKGKRARRVEERTVFILLKSAGISQPEDIRLALCRRGDEGLLAGMWELPNVEGWLEPNEAIARAVAWGAVPAALEQVRERVHLFTHVEWRMRGYMIRCARDEGAPEGKPGKDLVWISRDEYRAAYPLPTAFRQFLSEMSASETSAVL
ncbi:MAG: A/G-specific adenine glycosylase [Clostridiales bacterium]|nr:A/G-specific adenine glycosylase [Clostridiales bacterium]